MATTFDKSNPAHVFFHEHAAHSYDPKTETEEQGRQRCAVWLASAEAWARDIGVTYNWTPDSQTDSSDFDNTQPAWTLWVCQMVDFQGNVVNVLGGVDFGRDEEPAGKTYKRVVEAELASAEAPSDYGPQTAKDSALDALRDKLSDALEDPDGSNETVRDAACALLEYLNSLDK